MGEWVDGWMNKQSDRQMLSLDRLMKYFLPFYVLYLDKNILGKASCLRDATTYESIYLVIHLLSEV